VLHLQVAQPLSRGQLASTDLQRGWEVAQACEALRVPLVWSSHEATGGGGGKHVRPTMASTIRRQHVPVPTEAVQHSPLAGTNTRVV
jgi:hypothetical protein